MAKGREYEVAFKIGAELEASFKQTLGLTEQNLAEVNREVKKLTSNPGFKDMVKDIQDVNRKFNELESSVKDFGGVVKNVAEHVGAFELLDKAAGAFTDTISTVFDYGAAMSQIQSATGLTAKDMESINESTRGLYTKGLGEDYNDLADAVTVARQSTQLQGEELDNITNKALIYKDVFKEDVGESVRSADMLMKQFGLTADQAYNLMAQGNQRGLNKTNELLDTINEFSPQFKVLGYSAEEMFDFFATGLDAGAWNLDKVGDLVKEFDNRIKDAGDVAAQDALAQLFAPPNIDEFARALETGSTATKEYQELIARTDKDTAATLVKNLKKGGKSGADSMIALASILGDSQKILDGISSGGVRGADAMQMVLGKLSEIDDPIEKQTMAIAIMGTQYEDLGQKVTGALANVNSEFDMTAQTMQEIEAIKYDNLQTEWKQLTRELMDDFVLPLAQDVMPELREFVGFLSENKGLIKNLAVIIPGAMAVKGAANGIKSMSTLAKNATAAATGVGTAGKAMGALRIASSLLGGPLGLAVTGISAVTLGVKEYQRYQEESRQELLHFGDAVAEAYGNYKEVQDHTTKVKDLITEYDNLKGVIGDSATPTDELEKARARLLEIEQQLIDLNPDILKAEDAKSGKFREQLGLVEKMNQIESDRAKRELEVNFINNQDKVEDLESEFNKLTGNVAKFEEAYNSARESYVLYEEFVNQRDAILDNPNLTSIGREEEIMALIAKVNEATGKTYNGFADIDIASAAFKDAFDSNYKKLVKAQDELDIVNTSFEQIYDTAKSYIESNLGGTLEEQAAKFNEMSKAQQDTFIKALDDVAKLNRELDLLPSEKKINVQVVYDEARGLQYTPEHIKKTSVPDYRSFDQYADGGFANRPSIFGEAGLEAAIPINDKPRSHAILDEVNRMMGHDTSTEAFSIPPFNAPIDRLYEELDKINAQTINEGSVMQVTFAPNVTIDGGNTNVAQQVSSALIDQYPQFEAMMQRYINQQGRIWFK